MTNEQIKEILLAHGFRIKPGEKDLRFYVYNAVRAVLTAHDKAKKEAPAPFLEK
jgi:hypothetical protein